MKSASSSTMLVERRSFGPLVVTKGHGHRMYTEPRESEHDEEGHNYNMTLSSSTWRH